MRAGVRKLKDAMAEVTLEKRLQKKCSRGWGGYRMRYSACDKLEIIRPVETSSPPARRTLAVIGIPKPTCKAIVKLGGAR